MRVEHYAVKVADLLPNTRAANPEFTGAALFNDDTKNPDLADDGARNDGAGSSPRPNSLGDQNPDPRHLLIRQPRRGPTHAGH